MLGSGFGAMRCGKERMKNDEHNAEIQREKTWTEVET